jgi:hypothetical protein
MEAHLLNQLIQIKRRARDAVGRDLFAGFSVMLDMMSKDIPDSVPRTGTHQLLVKIQGKVFQMMQLLNAISLTVAQGFLGRCLNVTWCLKKLGVKVKSLVDNHTDTSPVGYETGPLSDDGLFVPEWVLDVMSIESAQVKSGALAARVATEGVMLQYSVDSRMDELLADIWMQAGDSDSLPVQSVPSVVVEFKFKFEYCMHSV